ncbi:MAG: LamG-like jellyroll fold domain-containing protein, partial [Candidatus Nanohalobium sp.]
CLTDDSKYSNSGVPHGFNDNNLATGSGWIQETPINRPTVKDYSTNSHLGTFYGGNNGQLKNFNLSHSDSGWTQGKIGEFALEFDGENDFVNISHVPKYNFTEFSVSIWAKDSADGWNDYLEKAGVFQLHHERGGYPSFRIFNSTGYSIDVEDGTPAVADGNWHHIVGTYNGEEACLYTDGSLVLCRNFDGPLANSTSPIELADDASNTNRYKGFLDDVRIYKKALSKSSVKSLYQGESVTKGLVGRWNFESGDRKTAYDTYYKSKGILSSSAIKTRPETYGVSDKVSFNESTVSAWYRKGELPEKVSSIGRRFATYCLLDTSDNQGTFSIASTHDGNFISIKELDSAGNVVDSWNKTVNKGQLWRFPCDDYGVDSAFKVTGTYPISMDYDSMIDARSSDDDWTSRAGEDIWFSIPNDNNELTITAYRNDTQVTLYNYSNGATKRSFTLDATEYWSCSDCTDNPAAFNVKTNGGHPVTVLYGKFDDNSGSSIMAPTRELYRVSKDYAENGQTIHIVAEEDNTNIEITDFAGGCTNTTITLNKGEVYSDSCGTGTINLKVNSTKPVSLTLIEANGDYGPSMFRSSTNTWGIGSEYYITASNDQGNSIGIISLAENNQIDISGSFSYSAELDKYENQYPVGNLPVNGYIHIDAEHPVAVIGDAGTNYESAMAILPLPKMNIAKAGKSGLGVTKDRVFGFNSGNIVSTRGLLHNNWQNIALTGGSNTSLYIGGEKQLTTNIASSSQTGSIEIGGVRGKIDELRIYNRSLSSSEVKELNLH